MVPLIWPGAKDPRIPAIQRVLRLPESGVYDQETAAKVRGLQRMLGLNVTGLVDEATWIVLHRMSAQQRGEESP